MTVKERLQKIKDESLHDGKGVIVHIENFEWLIEQAEKVERLDTENRKRKKYEGFLKSQIRSGNDLDDAHTFEWFCELWNGVL
jgi:hypothetical protein